jgi:esterase/lipase superfamily enzyme
MYCVTCRGKRGAGWGGTEWPRRFLSGDLVVSPAKFRVDILRSLRAAGPSPRLVAFVHGFNVTHADAMAKLALVRDGIAAVPGTVLVGFSWPSQGLTTNYLDDRGEARRAAEVLAGLVVDLQEMLKKERCDAQVCIVVHSMGAYLLGRAARHAAEVTGWPAARHVFGEAVLLAPDLDAQALEPGGEAHELPVFCRRVTVYWSRHDGALLASSAKRAGITGARLGRHGPADMARAPEHVVSVDCSAVVTGHSGYFEAPAVVEDVRAVLAGVDRTVIAGRVAGKRSREWSLERPQPTTPGPMAVIVQGGEEATT